MLMKNTKTVLLVTVGLSVLFYFWLTTDWWKIGFTVINSGFLVLLAAKFRNSIKNNKFWWAGWIASLILGGFLAIRSNEIINVLNVMTVILLNILLGVLAKEPKSDLEFIRLIETGATFLLSWFKALWGTGKAVLSRLPKKGNKGEKVIIGIIISLPLLAVFGGLFYAADPIFAQLINRMRLPEIDLSKIINIRTIFTLLFFGAMAAVLAHKLAEKKAGFRAWKYINETQIAGLILQGLFLIFTIIQIRYFGINTETLQQMGLTFSQYTRQGYSQMIISCLLAWGVVYGLDYLIRSQKVLGNKQITLSRLLSMTFMVEILIFVASATMRNWLYQNAYGFTQFRLLGFWLSLWIVAIVVITFIKIKRDKSVNFLVRNMILASLIILIGINIFNIDRTIAVTRPAKMAQGVDYEYMARLSNDAVEGWEDMFKDIEDRINKNEVTSVEEIGRLRYILNRVNDKEKQLELQSQNQWNFGGAWNASDAKAWEFLKTNRDRRENLEQKLNTLQTKFEIKEQEKN